MISFLLATWLTAQPRTPTVQLIGGSPVDISVESIQVATDGAVSVVSKHTLVYDRGTSIEIVDVPGRWIRFTTNRLQVTIPAGDLLATDEWRVQALPPNNVLSVWGAAGHVPRVPAGATLISAEAAACATAQTFMLGIGLPKGAGFPAFLRTTGTNDVARCRWIFLGLAPGHYEAVLTNARGLSGRQIFKVAAGETTDVVIPPPPVTVAGVAFLNHRPVTEGALQFTKQGGGSTMVPLEADGSYHTAFDEEGRYLVTLRLPYKTMRPISASFVRGANAFDIEVEDAEAETRLTVRVSGIDLTLPIGIEIKGRDGLISGVIPAGSDTFERRGVPYGRHRVSAHQPDATSDWRDFELSADEPSATADLALSRATRSLTLRYGDGEPVVSAGFSNTSARPEETAPGTYSLAGVPPYTELVVRPPSGAPLCKVVPAKGDIEAVAFSGRSITLRFQNRTVSVDEVRIKPEGSNCSVPLSRFLKSSLRPGPGQTTEVEILNAPRDEAIVVFTRDGGFRVEVPPNGIVFIPATQ